MLRRLSCLVPQKKGPVDFTRHLLAKGYQTHNGVYGYKPRPKRDFKIDQEVLTARNVQPNFYRLVSAFREHAHKQAAINPVALKPLRHLGELEPEKYGLLNDDVVRTFGILHGPANECTVQEAVHFLEYVYCNSLSAEFSYLESEEEREWFAEEMEETVPLEIPPQAKKAIAEEMLKSQVFDKFMASKFATVKRYGAEGAESMVAFFQELFHLSAKDDIRQLILCMPHRGRLNLLTGMFNFPPAALFSKLKGQFEFPDSAQATGDVVSHLTSTTDLDINGKNVHLTMLFCPSHLEAVNPVSMGKTRARQQTIKDGAYAKDQNKDWSDEVLNIQVHGDAAFAGQGINQETLNMTTVPHFEVGGTIHLVVNNQVGFTTPGERGRSSRYCCDLAKMVQAPVIHVNGNDPEMVFKATQIAFHYQRQFRKDVFIDMNCFRRWGHNELDDPSFTNPLQYKVINNQRTVPDLYKEKLDKDGIFSAEEADAFSQKHYDWLNNELKTAESYTPQVKYLAGPWGNVVQPEPAVTTWDTGVSPDLLKIFAHKSVSFPQDFGIHPHLLKTHVQNRIRRSQEGKDVDWATAEAMAFGSLLYEGYNVRISGQDVGRGTFSQRHAMLVDQDTNDTYIPLNDIDPEQKGHLEVANSILSEEAVLGFEYGMSIENPKRLAIWEAQFGDFFNGAQIQIDTFITSGETKWITCSGLVMLLPHGYDGAGPEHSSCRLERFLQLSDSSEVKPDGDNVNFNVVHPTTPAQYFHLLRRQMLRSFRKPLIVAAPKTLLRLAAATSSLEEMAPGTFFKPIIGDNQVVGNNVSRVIFTSGKQYYNLIEQRNKLDRKDVAIVRLESLCPFPTLELNKEMEKYPKAKSFVWSQEEPRNQGAWTFVAPRFYNLVGRKVLYRGRPTMAVPAVGYGKAHKQQAEEVIVSPFTP